MKLKPILPSLKEKKRYLSFEVIADKNVSAESAAKAVSQSTLQFLGTLEAGKAGIMFFKDKYNSNTGVIKTGHKYVDKVRSALALITKIDDTDVVVRTRIVSGTMKKAIGKFREIQKAEQSA